MATSALAIKSKFLPAERRKEWWKVHSLQLVQVSYFCSNFTGQTLVMWLHLVAREAVILDLILQGMCPWTLQNAGILLLLRKKEINDIAGKGIIHTTLIMG